MKTHDDDDDDDAAVFSATEERETREDTILLERIASDVQSQQSKQTRKTSTGGERENLKEGRKEKSL